MKKSAFFIGLFLLVTAATQAQNPPLTASDIIKSACVEAGSTGKNVLIIFHASWCYWCHKMDSSINDPVCKDLFDKNYVIRHLVVDESDEKKYLENPGASDFRDAQGGKGEGIPYWVVLDKGAAVQNNSRMPMPDGTTANTGCPAAPEEVDYFISILRKTSHLSEEELNTIRQRFLKNK